MYVKTVSKEMKSRSLSIFIGIVVLLTSCSQVPTSPLSLPEHPSDVAFASLPPVDADNNQHLFDYDKTMSLDIQEGMRGQHQGVIAQDFTFASPKGGRVPATLLHPPGRGPFAGIAMMHGMPGDRMQMLIFATAYASMGAKVILIDAPFARPEHKDRPDPLTFTSQDREEQIQLIVDLRRAIDILVSDPDVDPDRIAYLGVSYGGAMGGLLAGVEDRLQAYVLVVGDGGLVTHVTSAKDPSFYTLTQEEQDAWIASMWPIEPIHYVGRAAPAALLYLNGILDESVALADAVGFHEAGSQPKTVLWYEAGHLLPSQAARDQVEWLKQYVSGGNFYLIGPSFRASALVIDRVLLVWFALTASSLVLLLMDMFREGAAPWPIRLIWLLVVVFFGPLGLFVYFVSFRQSMRLEDQESGMSNLKYALGLTAWSVSSNFVGVILVLAGATVVDINLYVVIASAYVMAFIAGEIISSCTRWALMRDDRHRANPSRLLFTQIISTNLVLTGAGPVFLLLNRGWLEQWYPFGIDLGSPSFWGVLALAAIAGAIIVYPIHVWMIRRRLTQWIRPLDTGADYVLPEQEAHKIDRSKILVITMLTYLFLVAAFTLTI
jgi:dienelactone hydrolase